MPGIGTVSADVSGILPITTAKIADGAVTNPKIAAGAVTSDKLAALQNYGGPTFPASPNPNDQYFRTDLHDWFRFDGTAWLGPLNRTPIPPTKLVPLSATATGLGRIPGPAALGGDVFIEDYLISFYVAPGGSALSGAHSWVGTFNEYDVANVGTAMATASIDSGASNAWRTIRVPINDTADAGTVWEFQTDWIKTGTPGDLYITEMVTWRQVLAGGGAGAAPAISNVASGITGTAVSLVQEKANHSDTGTSLVVTLDNVPAVGNTLVLGYGGNNGGCSGIVQTGVTWTKVNEAGTNYGTSQWLGTAIAGGASKVITLTYASGRGNALVQERAGLLTASVLDKWNSAAGNSTTISSGAIVPVQNNETIVAIGTAFQVPTGGPTNGFVPAASSPVASATFNLMFATLEQPTAGSISTGWTIPINVWDGGIISLKSVPAGGLTISWDVAPAASGQVEYGLTSGYGSLSALDPSFAASHNIPLTGLAAGTTYHYRVHSVAADGTGAYSSDATFTTAGTTSSPPAITNLAVNPIGTTTATVSWNVDPISNGQVEYGPTSAYGSTSTLNASFLSSQSHNLTGLTAGTLYHYRVHSVDASGNSVYSPDGVFTTATSGGGLTRPWALPSTSGTVNISTGIDHTGATDVTAALQAAIDTCPDARILQFPTNPAYIYKISGDLHLANRHNLIIDGGGVTLNNVANANAGGLGNSYYSSFFWWSWVDTPSTHITIRNFVAHGASVPNVLQTGEHAAFLHAMAGSYIELDNITADKLFGDLITLNQSPGPDHVWVHNCNLISTGRHLISIMCGSDILVEQNTMGGSGYGVFDIEPEAGSADCLRITFRNNTITTYGFNTFLSVNGANSPWNVNDLVVSGNIVTNKSIRIASSYATAPHRVQRFTINGNFSGVSAAGPVFTLAHIDTLAVQGNVQPLSSGALFSISDCTNVTSSPNP